MTPSYCSGLRTFLGTAGLTRNVVKAGGNGRFGRRTFIWQGGGEVTLAYLKRNVLGFSMDFAEDVTKSNWAFEFSWINKVRLADSNSFSGDRDVQDFNLSISVDRPTFIRFLNSSRTFFMNLQMFMQYRDGYRKSMPSEGPFNFLFTFAVQTGYLQDRLLPSFGFVYDVNSQSGAAIPQVTYRISSNFSLGFGVAFFWGAPSWNAMPLSNLLLGNRGGDRPYENATYNGLGIIRKRDEVFFRLRYTF